MDARGDASNQKQESPAQEQLEVVGAEFEAVMGHARTGVAVYRAVDDGNDFVFVDFSHGAEEIEQINRADVIGRRVSEVFPGVEEFGLLDVFQRVWRTGTPESHPVSIYRDERITGWRQNYVRKLPNGLVMAIYDDVTPSKRSELVARMSEQRFRAIANYAYDWELWVGPNGRVLWMNPAATRISGYSLEELLAIADFPGPLIFEADRERIMQAFRSAIEGSTGNEQCRLVHKDGRIIWAEISWQPIYDEQGNPLGHRGSIRDITARKLAEQAAQLAEWEKEGILNSMAEHVIHMDADGSVFWANRAACESVGMTREQVIGHFCYEIPVDWHEPWGKCPAVEAIEAGERLEFERTSPEGRTWLIQAAPVRDQKGGIMGAVEVALDITRYKRADEALHELRREQEELEARAGAGDPADEET